MDHQLGRARLAVAQPLWDDYRWLMAKTSGRRPLLRLLAIIAAVAAAVVLRAALADKGGSYDPAEAAR